MSDLVRRTQEAISRVQGVVDRVCGSCDDSCCHQGTMMGSHDALRLIKGMKLEPGREEAVRAGLVGRARELRADLETLRSVRGLVAASGNAAQADLDKLDTLLDDWERFCEFLEGPWEVEEEALGQMQRFAGIRALALRVLGSVEGAHAALSTLAREGSGFRFRGRRLAPPRCLFHSLEGGCMAGRWKPGKCANFFCSGAPNVLHELHRELSFDDFVLGNAEVVDAETALRAVSLEWELGRRYVEPKVFIGWDEAGAARLRSLLSVVGLHLVGPPTPGGRFMQSSVEVEQMLDGLDETQACVAQVDAVDGVALYELAVTLDRRRAAGEAVAFILLAADFAAPSALPHPLWADEQMSQPLGALDLYVVALDG